MTNLLADIGNTYIKTATVVANKRGILKKYKTLDFQFFLDYINKKNFENTYIISTCTKQLTKIKKLKKTRLITANDIPIKTKYNIKQIGIDRILSAFGATKRHKPPLVIISLGSAITIDHVNKKSEFCGGLILPGVAKIRKTLHELNSKFVFARLCKNKVPALSTKESLNNGLYYLLTGVLNEFLKANKLSPKTQIIITGGNAKNLKNVFKNYNVSYQQHLTLDSIWALVKTLNIGCKRPTHS